MDVVPVVLTPHPNADSLSIVQVYGYTVVVRTDDWKDVYQGAYLPPDSVVDIDRPEFSWLKKPRIKACKLRGVISFGLLVPAPAGSCIGDNVAEILGVTHYDVEEARGVSKPGHGGPQHMLAPVPFKYDVDALRGAMKYGSIFALGERVYVTEKIDGENMRIMFDGEKFWLGSRSYWRGEGDKFWQAVTPEIEAWCRANVGWTLFGEKYGAGRYGRQDVSFLCFDIQRPDGTWVLPQDRAPQGVATVPVLYEGGFDFEHMKELAEGQSTLDDKTVREGIVIEAYDSVWHPRIGRRKLKIVGAGYLGVN